MSLFLLVFLFAHSVAQATSLSAGNFGDLSIAYNPKTHEVSGVYQKSIDENPECSFGFSGLQRGNVVQIRTHSLRGSNEELTGALSATKTGALKLILSAEPSACHGAPFLSEKRNPAIFRLGQRKNSLYLRVLKQSNPLIFPAPEVVKGVTQKWKAGEVFEIVDTRVGWLKLPRLSENENSWIQESNFFPLFEGDPRDIDKQ